MVSNIRPGDKKFRTRLGDGNVFYPDYGAFKLV